MKLKSNLTTADFYYPINKILRTDYLNIKLKKGNTIFICPYKINVSTPLKTIKGPFLEFLLFKFQSGINKDKCIFPYKIYTSGNPLKIANNIMTKILTKTTPEGYIEYENNIYFFYKTDPNIKYHKLLKKTDTLWWTLLDEICNSRIIVKFPIMKPVYNLFYNNPTLIYILDNNNNKIEIPSVAYTGGSMEWLQYNLSLGTFRRKGRYGPFYYFGSIKSETKYAGWLGNKKHKNGGGYVRYALFLGANKQILYRKTDIFYEYIKYLDTKKDMNKIIQNNKQLKKEANKLDKLIEDWPKHGFDSITSSSIKYNKFENAYFERPRRFVIKSFDQHLPLTYHILDVKTINTFFDFNNEKYCIV